MQLKYENYNFIPRSHMNVEGKKQVHKFGLWLLHASVPFVSPSPNILHIHTAIDITDISEK